MHKAALRCCRSPLAAAAAWSSPLLLAASDSSPSHASADNPPLATVSQRLLSVLAVDHLMELTNRPLLLCKKYLYTPPSTKRTLTNVGVNDAITICYKPSHAGVQSRTISLTVTDSVFPLAYVIHPSLMVCKYKSTIIQHRSYFHSDNYTA